MCSPEVGFVSGRHSAHWEQTLQHSPHVQTFGFSASGCTVWQVWNIQTSLIIGRVFSQMVWRTFCKFSSVLLDDGWYEGSKSITEVWIVLEHQCHSHGVTRKASLKHFKSQLLVSQVWSNTCCKFSVPSGLPFHWGTVGREQTHHGPSEASVA